MRMPVLAIMVCFMHYVSSRPGGFHLVSFQKTKKEKNIQEKLRNENEQDENKLKIIKK